MSKELNLPGSEMPVIDESRLMARIRRGWEILRELRDLFLDHAPPLYKAMKEAIGNGDCEKVGPGGPQLQGCLRDLWRPAPGYRLQGIRVVGQGRDLPTIRENIAHLEIEYHAVFEAIGTIGVG